MRLSEELKVIGQKGLQSHKTVVSLHRRRWLVSRSVGNPYEIKYKTKGCISDL